MNSSSSYQQNIAVEEIAQLIAELHASRKVVEAAREFDRIAIGVPILDRLLRRLRAAVAAVDAVRNTA